MIRFLAPLILLLIAALLYLGWVALTPAHAHDWYTGLKNTFNDSCCDGEGEARDCGNVPPGAVREVSGGFIVALTKEQMIRIRPSLANAPTGSPFARLTWGISEFVPYAEAMPAMDGDYSICLNGYPKQRGTAGPLRWTICFFFPMNT